MTTMRVFIRPPAARSVAMGWSGVKRPLALRAGILRLSIRAAIKVRRSHQDREEGPGAAGIVTLWARATASRKVIANRLSPRAKRRKVSVRGI